jgi:glutathione S-transferase
MKLFFNKPSPYARKVRVVAHEKALTDRLEMVEVDPWSDPPELLAANPLAKVPALLTDDGTLITESTALGAYLDGLGHGRKLVDGERWRVMARASFAQGLMDAAFITVIERRRPAERQWSDWIKRQHRAIERTLPSFTPEYLGDANRFDLGDITLACGLAYLDFRLGDIPWRAQHPHLAQWLDQINQRPSMLATVP